MNKKKTILLIFILIMIPFISTSNNQIAFTKSEKIINQTDKLVSNLFFTPDVDPFFSLLFKTVDSEPYPNYGNFLKQQLAEIGINIDVVIGFASIIWLHRIKLNDEY